MPEGKERKAQVSFPESLFTVPMVFVFLRGTTGNSIPGGYIFLFSCQNSHHTYVLIRSRSPEPQSHFFALHSLRVLKLFVPSPFLVIYRLFSIGSTPFRSLNKMEPSTLLTVSLALIAAVNILLLLIYLLTPRLLWPPELHVDWPRTFAECLIMLCLVQTVLLSVGFGPIARDLHTIYREQIGFDDRRPISLVWDGCVVVIGCSTGVVIIALCLAIHILYRSASMLSHNRHVKTRHLWASHFTLDIAAVISVCLSCAGIWKGEGISRGNMILALVLSTFAIIAFVVGVAFWIYGVLDHRNCFTGDAYRYGIDENNNFNQSRHGLWSLFRY